MISLVEIERQITAKVAKNYEEAIGKELLNIEDAVEQITDRSAMEYEIVTSLRKIQELFNVAKQEFGDIQRKPENANKSISRETT